MDNSNTNEMVNLTTDDILKVLETATITSENFNSVLSMFAEMTNERKQLDKKLKAMKEILTPVSEKLYEYMLDQGWSQIKTDFGTCYLKSQLWAKVLDTYMSEIIVEKDIIIGITEYKKGDKLESISYISNAEKTRRSIAALEAIGLHEHLKSGVNTQSFSTYIRKMDSDLNGPIMPDVEFTWINDSGETVTSKFDEAIGYSETTSLQVRK